MLLPAFSVLGLQVCLHTQILSVDSGAVTQVLMLVQQMLYWLIWFPSPESTFLHRWKCHIGQGDYPGAPRGSRTLRKADLLLAYSYFLVILLKGFCLVVGGDWNCISVHLTEPIHSLFMTEIWHTGLRKEATATSLILTLSPYNLG